MFISTISVYYLTFVTSKYVFISAATSVTYDCTTNDTVFLSLNELAFFQTSNYPKSLTAEEFHECDINIVLNNKNNNHNNTRLYSMTIGDKGYDGILPMLSNSRSFKLRNNIPGDRFAEIGHVLFEKWDDSCLLESISRNEPYMFTDETQLIYITSSFKLNSSNYFFRKNDCKWQFSAPTGYGFKVVVYHFDATLVSSFMIENSTDVLVNERSVKHGHPYYNIDNWIQISLLKGKPEPISNYNWAEFGATVSIVKNNYQIKEQESFIKITDDRSWTWTNVDDNYTGYENNVRCTFNLLIFPNTEVFIYAVLNVENFVDVITYYSEENDKQVISVTQKILILPYYNGSIKEILFEFLSDGSFQSTGFWINFIYQLCKCANPVIPCNVQNYTIMDGTDYYCGNLLCRFILPKCSEELLIIRLMFGFSYVEGIFKVISNGVTVLNVDPLINGGKEIYAFLNSSNENLFEPYTALHVDETILLSLESPTYILDTSVVTLAVVEISKELELQNLSVLVYSNNEPYSYFQLYTNESLTEAIVDHKCFDVNTQLPCKITRQKFVIFVPRNQQVYPFLALQLKKNNYGCIFEKNVFVQNDTNYLPIVGMADNWEECVIHLLNEFTMDYKISHIWTTSLKENVKTYIGINKTKLYFEFNSKTAKKWNEFYLLSRTYTFVIPKSSTLYIVLERIQSGQMSKKMMGTLVKPIRPYSTLLATLNYGNSKANIFYPGKDYLTFIVTEHPLKFTAVDYFKMKGDNCTFISGDNKYFINKTGDSLIFVNQSVTFHYSYSISDEVNNGGLFFIETQNKKII